MVIMLGTAQVLMGKYSLMSGKRFHGPTLAKMFLHQSWGAEGVKQRAGPQYNHRNTDLRVFGTVLVVVI